jgi:hypothetical protein
MLKSEAIFLRPVLYGHGSFAYNFSKVVFSMKRAFGLGAREV